MILLHTNVLSAVMRPVPEQRVLSWLDRQPRISVWTTSVTILEIDYGLRIMPAGRKRTHLLTAFERMVSDVLENRVRSFDTAAATRAAELLAARRKAGKPVELRDTMIAGIALASHATLATRNTRHFADLAVPVVDPWQD